MGAHEAAAFVPTAPPPPPPVAPPPPPPPSAGVLADTVRPLVGVRAGTAGRCVTSGSTTIRITASDARLRRVTVSINGRRIRVSSRGRLTIRVPAGSLRIGRNRVLVIAVDNSGNRRAVRRTIFRCRRAAPPRFTG